MSSVIQLDLFDHVAMAYGQTKSGRLSNEDLYKMAVGRAGHQPKVLEEKVPVGIAKSPRSLVQRAIRWHQQTLRAQGLITKVSGVRGVWELTQSGKEKLRKIKSGAMVLGFSTDLGIAVWGSCIDVFSNLDEPICLALTSPPYPLRAPRAYGNPPIEQYIDFMCEILEPIVKNLVTGGNIALSVSQDIFESQSPARSLYLEKLTLALCERLGLSLMDRIVWESNKPPGPLQWASKQRVQLNTGYEYVLWFTNDPLRCISDNRRVLEEHTPAHKKLIAQGGEKRECVNGDGAYRIRHGSYGNDTPGRIPRNVMHVSNVCSSQRQYKQRARELGLVAHGATMPLALARKLVRFLSDVGQLIVDPCGGSMTTALASELEGRAWASSEVVYDYVRGAAERFRSSAGFESSL